MAARALSEVGEFGEESMKRSLVLLLLAVTTAATAQVKLTNIIATRQEAPTYSDVYCAGFISNQPLQRSGYVAGGWETPHQTRFVDGGYVYLEGSGFALGSQYWLVRQVRDLNHYESFRGQGTLLRQLGRPYADIGR